MAKSEIPKAYEASNYEDGIYAAWEASGLFNPDNLPGDRAEPFSIVLPPPNATGTLHMGHAVMLAIEDIMVRFARMRGKKALWIPGTDHAAIATNAKVEKILAMEGKTKYDLGREGFVGRVKEFVADSQATIRHQLRKMGASLDWSREAYTLDDARSASVRAAFKMMYDDGLIYRGHRVVNWCPHCQSTLADDEVQYKEETSKFYYLKYGPVVIGTARPETKFHDKVIVVNPEDARYADMVGTSFEVEWIEGKVKATVIADKEADMTFGTGAMTITPAHSHEDFGIAQAHNLEIVSIIREDGNLTDAAGSFAGRNARESRDEIVAVLAKKGLVERIDKNYVHNLSICYRCGTAVDPLPKLQWFVNVTKPFAFRASTHAPIVGLTDGQTVTLKELMQHAVRSKQVDILPKRFEKTYFHWIDNLRDWCISRQIWFGHRVPVWYRGEETVVGEEPAGEGWTQDPDTLDTWFSSGIWTISTLGWPNKDSADFRTFHPTTVLETGYDIIFQWVARMILMTTYAVGEIPFKLVYLHGLVRDEQGRKMSKSLENIIDPLDMIAKYGADATRLSLVIGSTPGNDSKLSEEKVAGYRNFTNKLWNIARFVLMTTETTPNPSSPEEGKRVSPPDSQEGLRGGLHVETLADRWILSRLDAVVASVTKKLDTHEFSAAGEELRDFTWNDFADWYLEIAKVQKGTDGTNETEGTDAILLHVLETVLTMWHPFMPFVTEAIWKEFPGTLVPSNVDATDATKVAGNLSAGGNFMIVKPWPTAAGTRDEAAEREFAVLQEAIVSIRNIRATQKVEPAKKVSITLGDASLLAFADLIKRLARVEDITVGEKPGIQLVLGSMDIEAERARLSKERDDLSKYLVSTDAKLANADFTARAPEKVVNEMRAKRDEAAVKLAAIESQLSSLRT